MTKYFFSLLTALFVSLSAFGQIGLHLNVALKYQIQAPGSSGTSPNFTVTGMVNDDLSRWAASDVAIGDSMYVLDGPDLFVFTVTSIIFAGGNTLNIGVTALDNDLFQIPSGQAAIIRPTVNKRLPTYISGLRDDLRSAIMNRMSQLIDDAPGGGADGTVTGATYDGSTLTLERSLGVDVTTTIREVVNTNSNPAGAPGTGEKVYINNTTGNMWYASGGAWVPLVTGGSTWTEEFFPSVSTSTITTSGSLPVTDTEKRVILYRTGVKMRQGFDYTLSGNVFTLVIPGNAENFTVRFQ